jgi:hypothetical protein
LSKFGPFASAFEKGDLAVGGYLTLLNMSPDCQVAMDRVEHAIRESRDVGDGDVDLATWIRRLFDEVNWRPHLVGAIALLLGGGGLSEIGALWRAIDRGSWVGPQLVVTACFRDPDFPSAARARIAARCPLLEGAWGNPPPRQFIAKTLSSLLHVATGFPSLAGWVENVRQEADVVELLREDRDHGGGIASDWMDAVMQEFNRRGRWLVPAGRLSP